MSKKRRKPITKNQKKIKRKCKSIWFIPVGLILGILLGILIKNFVSGIFFGLGIGFLVFAIINLLKKR